MACQTDRPRGKNKLVSECDTTYDLALSDASVFTGDNLVRTTSHVPGTASALHTLVDMALALEENAIRRAADHTYALKKQNRKVPFPAEDLDKVSSEKDHTYASNTIGFRYSNHRSIHAQPRKSASEESLLIKTSSDTTARKCTSAEEFTFLEQASTNSSVFNNFSTNAATLPRSKNRLRPPSTNRQFNNSDSGTPSMKENLMDIASNADHTYAKYGSLNSDDPSSSLKILSTSAPGKFELLHLDTVSVIPVVSSNDHTYDKLSSSKIKDLQQTVYRSTLVSSKDETNAQDLATEMEDINSSMVTSTIMDWQPLENMQSFERRFMPVDHTYTTVA